MAWSSTRVRTQSLAVPFTIQRNTLAVANPINFAFYAEAPAAWAKANLTGKPLRMEVKESIFAGPIHCDFGFQPGLQES